MSGVLIPLLSAPSLLFEGLVRLRNWAYDTSLLPQTALPQPVVSVGNLTVGGSGKTPLVIHLAKSACRLGFTPVLLSRGYGRSENGIVFLPPGTDAGIPVASVGDEPALIRRHVPEIWLGISRDRHKAGLEIARRRDRLLFILDDGFQHRRLCRDLDLVVLDTSQSLSRNHLLPLGTLREPLSGLHRASVAVLNGSAGKDLDTLAASVRRLHPGLPVWHCEQYIERIIALEEWRGMIPGERAGCRTAPLFLVAAIGNPKRFHRDVEMLGVEIRGARFFRDHTCLRPGDWDACIRAAVAVGAEALLITEKDAIKNTGNHEFPIFVAIQSTRIAEQAELEHRLSVLIKRCH